MGDGRHAIALRAPHRRGIDIAHVLIAGASSGFGTEMAHRLAAKGHRVLATMRDIAGPNARAGADLIAAAEGATGSIDVLEMEVTDDASVRTAVDAALESAGYLDVVINNAGIFSLGLTEAFTPADFARVPRQGSTRQPKWRFANARPEPDFK